jgi:hypothetical protein
MNQVDVVDNVHVEAVYEDGEAHDLVDEQRHSRAKFAVESAEIQQVREVVSYSLDLVLSWTLAGH